MVATRVFRGRYLKDSWPIVDAARHGYLMGIDASSKSFCYPACFPRDLSVLEKVLGLLGDELDLVGVFAEMWIEAEFDRELLPDVFWADGMVLVPRSDMGRYQQEQVQALGQQAADDGKNHREERLDRPDQVAAHEADHTVHAPDTVSSGELMEDAESWPFPDQPKYNDDDGSHIVCLRAMTVLTTSSHTNITSEARPECY